MATAIQIVLYLVFGQVLVYGGMGPIEKPWFFWAAIFIFLANDIISFRSALYGSK